MARTQIRHTATLATGPGRWRGKPLAAVPVCRLRSAAWPAAASLAGSAAEHRARLVIVNAEPTPYDAVADEVIRAPIGAALTVLPALPATPVQRPDG
jgi:hypothetical protein